jgi:pimeloyl-ACP methyl ester carboxylesterase
MIATRDVVVSGVRSAVFDSGPPRCAEAVAFVHGNPGPLDDWEFALSAVAQGARAVALDMPGFGRADRPRDFDFSPAGYARHMAGVLEQLGVARVHLVLHDLGGAWGLAWALAHPRAVASVTLINCVPLMEFRWHFFARLWQLPILGELFQLSTSDWAIASVMKRDNPRPLPEAFVARVLRYADMRQKFAVLKIYRSVRDTRQSFASMVPALRALDLPACVIWGESDPYLAPACAESFVHAFPHAELVRLPGLGHWPFIDDPALVRGALLAFLHAQGALTVAEHAREQLGSRS